jgi:tetratricopeptide (TPR) repeat protein
MINEIIKEDPEIIDAYFTLGNLYFKERKFEKALEYFLEVLDKRPDDAFTVINIANSYVSMGNLVPIPMSAWEILRKQKNSF